MEDWWCRKYVMLYCNKRIYWSNISTKNGARKRCSPHPTSSNFGDPFFWSFWIDTPLSNLNWNMFPLIPIDEWIVPMSTIWLFNSLPCWISGWYFFTLVQNKNWETHLIKIFEIYIDLWWSILNLIYSKSM
jgi:hypothetical protein